MGCGLIAIGIPPTPEEFWRIILFIKARKAGLRVKSAMATGTDRPGICPNPHRITIKLVYEANTQMCIRDRTLACPSAIKLCWQAIWKPMAKMPAM